VLVPGKRAWNKFIEEEPFPELPDGSGLIVNVPFINYMSPEERTACLVWVKKKINLINSTWFNMQTS
jgi:hypothetical protein